jgi:ABC-type multidrug transport system ATPase subunit
MPFFRQTWTLTSKTFLIVLRRHWFATFIRAIILPLVLTAFLSFAKNLFVPPANFGVGASSPVWGLHDALVEASKSGRQTVAFVNNGLVGGDIEQVINSLASTVTSAGANARVLTSQTDLLTVCRATLRGVTPCYGAVVFNASPNEGKGGLWNYTMRSDGSLGLGKIDVDKDNNDAQIYMFPFQHAIDAAIASVDGSSFPAVTNQYPFTALTKEERADRIRTMYQAAIMNFLGVTFIAGIIGVVYHMTGFIASERETGMSTLIEAMMPTKRPWQAQASRLLSYHVSFSLIYLPSWIIGSIILARGVFSHTNVGLVLIYHVLSGLALSSMSIFGASFFKKSQLSGVSVTIIYILLAVIAQTVSWPKTGTVAVLSLLFAPCNYTYFISLLARWEQQEWPTDLTKVAPNSPWALPGIVLWIFLIIQIIVYPILGALLERYFHGTATNTRNIVYGPKSQEGAGAENAVRLEGFTKVYSPGFARRIFSFVSKPKDPVVAVNGLTLSAGRGQILVLLGANGSGKSTTLDAIAGTNKLTSGNITIDGTGGLGIAPQKNVLWDELSVEEHITIFNRLKSPNQRASREEIRQLVHSIDLDAKIKAQSKTLSGGQKRKLQLGMMLTGGSAVCCVDEVSSGLDPLSRRKIWDILLAERGRRTIIMTTHFLDEADLLADRIAILSKGTLRAEGSSVELKDKLGGGYRIHVHNVKDSAITPDTNGVTKKIAFDMVTYIAPSSGLAAQVIKTLEANNISDYGFSGPTIEDVFLQLAEEVRGESNDSLDNSLTAATHINGKHANSDNIIAVDEPGKDGLELLSGQKIGYFRQACVLFLKRCTIFKTNWFPYAAAFVIPVAAAGLVTLFVKNRSLPGCTPSERNAVSTADIDIFSSDLDFFLVGGPPSKLNNDTLIRLFAPIFLNTVRNTTSSTAGSNGSSIVSDPLSLFKNITVVNSLAEFNNMLVQDRKNVTPAGLWLGDANSPPTIAYKGQGAEMVNAWFGGWIFDMLLANKTIASSYLNFDTPWAPDTGNSLQLLVYIGLALSAYPGFFALYPNLERRRNVRGLQYSNGVRTLPLWLAYVMFDFAIVIVSSALAIILFAALSQVWYNVAYLFLIFVLYGLASILLSYVISLFSSNQLSAYAFTAAGQAVMFLVYLIAYLSTITYAPVNRVDENLILVHFVVSVFAPIGSVVRSMFLALNLFSVTCVDDRIAPNPGGILQYGGPILYLILQSIFLFILLLWLDSGDVGSSLKRLFRRNKSNAAAQDPDGSDEEIANELVRVTSTATASGKPSSASTDGLRVVHLTKTFGKNTAVDNVTFGVKHGEVFALLGPNGAGKSTTISMIRGDLKPSHNGGDVLVESVSVTRHLAAARSNLGVCPQFDAVDQMTVAEHLRFYARVRGIPDVEHNVEAIIRAVGLQAFRGRQAFALSGGNKRKLSLGIALMGNPSVVLLDEPSSGLDAAAKRVMWRTLAAAVPGRSILLTTHSMEEADALAGRAGILAKRMLAMGSTEGLRRRFGDRLHVHLVCRGAPRTGEEEVERVRGWIRMEMPEAEVEEKTYHGQMRFSIPAAAVVGRRIGGGEKGDMIEKVDASSSESAIGKLVVLLEENREVLGIEHYSVSPTTLDQVFLAVVGKHGIQEEGYEVKEKKKRWWSFGG